jgi:sugar-specific transcriptional regulator TrmB
LNYPDEYISTLIELGLSSSRAKVYLTLLKSNNLTAGKIHEICGYARSDIYRILGELKEVGLVEKIISRPENFHAVPIDECTSTLLQQRMQKTQQLQKEALKLTRALREKTEAHESAEKSGFTLITGRDAVYAKAERILRNTQTNVCFLGFARRMIAWLSNSLPSFEKMLARNVECRMIMPKPEKNLWKPLDSLGQYNNFSLKFISKQPETGFSVWDNNEILITTSAIDSPTPAATIWSNNKSIVDLCQGYFECLWDKAERAILKI